MPIMSVEEWERKYGGAVSKEEAAYPPDATFLRSAEGKPSPYAYADPHELKRFFEGRRKSFFDLLKESTKDVGTDTAMMAGALYLARQGAAALPGPYKALAVPLVAAPFYKAMQGAWEGKPPIETLKEIPGETALWGGLEVAGPLLGAMERAVPVGRTIKGVAGLAKETPSLFLRALVDAPIAKPLQKVLPHTFPGGTLRELFQPVAERAEPFLKGVLRRRDLISDRGRQAATAMENQIKELPLEERYYVADFIRSTRFDPGKGRNIRSYMKLPLDSKRRITETLRPMAVFLDEAGKLDPLRQEIRLVEFHRQVQERVLPALAEEGGVLEPTYLEELKPFLKGEGGMETAIASLREILAHPELSEESKMLAKDLLSLHHTVADTFPTALQHTEKAILFDKLKKMPRHVSIIPGEDKVKSTHPAFKGLWVSKDADQAIKDYEYVPTWFSRGINKYFMTPWKMAKVVLRGPAHFRNMISNPILNDLGGMSLFQRSTYYDYYQAAKEIRAQSKGLKEFSELTGYSTTFAEVETAPLLRAMTKSADLLEATNSYLKHTLASYERGFLYVAEKMNKAYQMEEVWAKYAKYLNNIRKGMPKKRAAEDAVRWTFNYGQVTPLTKSIRQTVMPFATWTVKVLPLLAESAAKNPLRVAKWALLPAFATQLSLRNLGLSNQEWDRMRDNMPHYLSKGLVGLVPTRDSQGRLQMINYTWFLPGVGDLAQLYAGLGSGQEVAQTLIQNPLITILGDLAHNETRTGVPIWYEWEPPDLKAQKFLSYLYMQLAPGMISIDMAKLKRTIDAFEGAPTTGQFAAGQFGVPIIPLEPERLEMQKMRKLQRVMGEIRGSMRREMERARSPLQQTNIERKYLKILEEVMKEEGPK
ncbi:MAG: hypothetical protein ACWGQW_00950 [bacterium]